MNSHGPTSADSASEFSPGGAAEALVLQPMRPEHLPRVAAIHAAAFAGHTLTLLGSRFVCLYYRRLLQDPRGLALVALRQQGVCGFAAGMIGPQSFYRDLWRRHALDFLLAALPGLCRHPGLASKLAAAPRFAGLHPVGDHDATLASIAVAPGAARGGVGRALFTAFARLAGERGARVLHWGAKPEEVAAVAFYARLPRVIRNTVTGAHGESVFDYRLDLADSGAGA